MLRLLSAVFAHAIARFGALFYPLSIFCQITRMVVRGLICNLIFPSVATLAAGQAENQPTSGSQGNKSLDLSTYRTYSCDQVFENGLDAAVKELKVALRPEPGSPGYADINTSKFLQRWLDEIPQPQGKVEARQAQSELEQWSGCTVLAVSEAMQEYPWKPSSLSVPVWFETYDASGLHDDDPGSFLIFAALKGYGPGIPRSRNDVKWPIEGRTSVMSGENRVPLPPKGNPAGNAYRPGPTEHLGRASMYFGKSWALPCEPRLGVRIILWAERDRSGF